MEPIMIIVLSIIFLFLLKLSGKSKKARYIDELPGPSGLPLLGNTVTFIKESIYEQQFNETKRDRQYGPIYRTWVWNTPYIHITTVQLAQIVLERLRAKNGANHQRFYWLDEKLLLLNSQSMLNTIHTNSIAFIKKIMNYSLEDTELFYSDLSLFSLELAHESLLGLSMHSQVNEVNEYVKAATAAMEHLKYRNKRLWLHNNFIWRATSKGKEMEKFTCTMRESVHKLQKIEETPHNKHLLKEAESMVMAVFRAKSHINSALVNAIMYLVKYQQIQEELYEEQVSLKEDELSWHHIAKMKKLELFLRETLRLKPIISFKDVSLANNIEIGDFNIPEGTVLHFSLSRMLKDSKLYADPDKFDLNRTPLANPLLEQFFIEQRSLIDQGIVFISYLLMNFKIGGRKLPHQYKLKFTPRKNKFKSYLVIKEEEKRQLPLLK